jgi:hypothetical protein
MNSKQLFISPFVALLLCISLYAQDGMKYLNDHPGNITYKFHKNEPGYTEEQKYSADEEKIVKSKLELINKYLQNNPGLSKPRGVEIFITSKFSDKSVEAVWNKSLRMEINLVLFPWFMKNGKPSFNCSVCSKGFQLLINQPEAIFDGLSLLGNRDITDAGGYMMMVEPSQIYVKDKFKFFENGIVLIEKPQTPLLIPVTVKEYDAALIRKYETLNKDNPENSFSNNLLINKIKGEMRSYNQEELQSSAYLGDKFGGCAVKLDENAKMIVKLNPDYFEKNKSRTDIQLIILKSFNIALQSDGTPYSLGEYSTYEDIRIADILTGINYTELSHFLD